MSNQKIKDLPETQRPREKLLLQGANQLENYELLAILLGYGTKGKSALELAQEIIDNYELSRLQTISLNELIQIKGINSAKACTIIAARELMSRILDVSGPQLPQIESPRDAALMLNFLKDQTKENFVVIYLNTRHQVIHQEIISVGTINDTLAHPREVFEPAFRHLASAIIIAHNHPSGDLSPSQNDLEITKQLVESGQILGIKVVDHIIISKSGFCSLQDLGLM